jgi:hypothetical protein
MGLATNIFPIIFLGHELRTFAHKNAPHFLDLKGFVLTVDLSDTSYSVVYIVLIIFL